MKNNQSHLGIIRTSNLCTEIVQYSSTTETAVCTLGSIAVARFVRPDRTYDFESLQTTVRLAVLCLDRLIDKNTYPTEASKQSAHDTRSLGVGVQGLADAFMASRMPFDSTAAKDLNRAIFETIYYAAYDTSCELARLHGPYPVYPNSPASRGVLQHDMWPDVVLSGRHDFAALRKRIHTYGLRNSMLTAQMPTASTAKLLGNFDGAEPYTRQANTSYLPRTSMLMLSPAASNILTHRILSGDFTEVCPWLVCELAARGLWTDHIRISILRNHGPHMFTVVTSAY